MASGKKSMAELQRLSGEEFRDAEKLPLVIVLDNIRSGLNVGSVFRTADAYRVEEVLLCGITARPPQKDIQKSALGATESVRWSYHESTESALKRLKKEGYRIASIEQTHNSVSLEDWQPEGHKWAFVLGNEVRGVEPGAIEASDAVIELPQFGTKHSLNISVCAGIVIWEAYRKLGDLS